MLRSIVLGWILIYQNCSIGFSQFANRPLVLKRHVFVDFSFVFWVCKIILRNFRFSSSFEFSVKYFGENLPWKSSSQEREIKDSDCTFHYTPVRVVWKKHTQKTLSQKNKECLSQINPRIKYPAVQKTSHHWSGDNQEKTQSFVTKLNLNSTWQVVETSLDRFYVCKIEIYLHKEVKTK